MSGKEEVLKARKDVDAAKVERLEREVRIWSPACSVFWALWGIIQAEEHVGKMVEDANWSPEFDYLVSTAKTLLMIVICDGTAGNVQKRSFRAGSASPATKIEMNVYLRSRCLVVVSRCVDIRPGNTSTGRCRCTETT
jgi:hypothetical protein